MQQCQVRVFHHFFPSFDPNEWCLKNGLHSGGLNPGPLGLESSALPKQTITTDFHFESSLITNTNNDW